MREISCVAARDRSTAADELELRRSANKERGDDEHTRGEADIDRLTFPPIDRMLFCQAFVGRRSGDRLGKLPSAGAGQMGILTVWCIYGAHERSHREKPV